MCERVTPVYGARVRAFAELLGRSHKLPLSGRSPRASVVATEGDAVDGGGMGLNVMAGGAQRRGVGVAVACERGRGGPIRSPRSALAPGSGGATRKRGIRRSTLPSTIPATLW